MSVSFQGPKNSLDVNNGLASRLLRAIGYEVEESTDGSMPLGPAKEGIERAKKTLSGEDLQFLLWLEELVFDVEAKGGNALVWF